MKRVVREQRLAFIATVCPDGTPNLSPKATIAVWDDNHLVFAYIRSPGTTANIRTNAAVEVNVVDPFSRKGCRFKDRSQAIVAGELFDQIMSFYQKRWVDVGTRKPQPLVRAFVLIDVKRALPLNSPANDDGSRRDSIRTQWDFIFRQSRAVKAMRQLGVRRDVVNWLPVSRIVQGFILSFTAACEHVYSANAKSQS